MSKRAMRLGVAGVGAICVVTLVAWAGDEHEEQVTLEEVPAAVKATILKESAGGKITEIERETQNGKTTYEAEFLLNGQEVEIEIAPDGTLLGREVENERDDDDDLTLDQVPGPARAALLELAGGAKITEVERERDHGGLVYEAEWTANGTQHEAAVTADGALIEIEETILVAKAPAAVRAAIAQHFAANVKVVVEKKMIVVYEIEARINGREKEILVFPNGRIHEGGDDDDDDDHDDDDDDDDHDDDDDD
ncbi:MAG: hypothetical protein GY778_19250 [bacterium]|nr:hypothetical protein [bacterium]